MPTPILKRAGASLLVLVPLLLLVSCYRHPPAVPVSFPDDPRVLHGEWEMDLRLLDWAASHHLYLPHHELLLTWSSESVRGWQQTADEWTEVPADAFTGLDSAAYDPVLDAFVTFRLGNGAGTATVISLPDGVRAQVGIDLPVDVTPLDSTAGSGNLFVFGQGTSSNPRLYWWDAKTGEPGGSIALQRTTEGMQRSSNGRLLSFWNFWTGTVQVVDMASPGTPKEFRLAFCRATGLAEASSDGRWFALRECNDRISIVDLHAATPVRAATGLASDGFVSFADDSAELLSVGESGLVRSFDAVSREMQALYTVPEDDRPWSPYSQHLSLNRSADSLTVLSAYGNVLMVDLEVGDVTTRLPEPVTGTVRLQLTASNLRNEARYSYYELSGTAQWPAELGEAEEIIATGSVTSYGLHNYRPELGAQAAPPPDVSVYGQLSGKDVEYTLGFRSYDVHAREYHGMVRVDSSEPLEYGALLRRP